MVILRSELLAEPFASCCAASCSGLLRVGERLVIYGPRLWRLALAALARAAARWRLPLAGALGRQRFSDSPEISLTLRASSGQPSVGLLVVAVVGGEAVGRCNWRCWQHTHGNATRQLLRRRRPLLLSFLLLLLARALLLLLALLLLVLLLASSSARLDGGRCGHSHSHTAHCTPHTAHGTRHTHKHLCGTDARRTRTTHELVAVPEFAMEPNWIARALRDGNSSSVVPVARRARGPPATTQPRRDGRPARADQLSQRPCAARACRRDCAQTSPARAGASRKSEQRRRHSSGASGRARPSPAWECGRPREGGGTGAPAAALDGAGPRRPPLCGPLCDARA